MSSALVISLLLPGLTFFSLPAQALSPQVTIEKTLFASASRNLPVENLEIIPPPLGEIADNSCHDLPTGVGIPGFRPGIHKNDVIRMLGVPARSSSGYWPNTRAVSYELIPEQVSLGFLFDKKSQKIRQTEASFASGVSDELVLPTFKAMLGCQMEERIQEGLQQVRQKKIRRFNFTLEKLKGVIEQEGRDSAKPSAKGDRIYIGIWEADLH